MKFLPALFAILLIATSCKQRASQAANDTTGKDSTAINDSTLAYLPVADLIREDLQRVDSFAGGILKKTTVNGKKDSVFIKLHELHQLAGAFLVPELEPAIFRKSFTESSIMDESTQLLQFIYTPNSPGSGLRNVVAYITPSNSGNTVSRIYMEREFAAGDTLVQQKLTWKTRQYCYIITIRQPRQGTPLTSVEKLIWDPVQFDQ
jgi:hypothetical protein